MTAIFLCVSLSYGYLLLEKGNLSPSQYNLRVQILGLVAFLPLILYFLLHITWLRQTDSSWDFDLELLDESAGWQITNEWPFETESQDSRWKFYQVGVFNSLRVVFLSIICSTLLGIVVGVSRLSRNKILSNLAKTYVDIFRNIPLVAQLFFVMVWFLTVLDPYSELKNNNFLEWIYWSNRNIVFPKIEVGNLSYLILGVSIYLIYRIYTRFSERYFSSDYIADKRFHHRPFYSLGKKWEPVVVDSIFSLSILFILYGITNVVDWYYEFSLSEILNKSPFSFSVLGFVLIYLSLYLNKNLEHDGLNNFTDNLIESSSDFKFQIRVIVFIIALIFIYSSLSIDKPNLITEKEGKEVSWGLWKFEEGTYSDVTSVFLVLMFGLTLYTTAQIAEVVRGSIQALPAGQIEAAISVGLSPYQRLKLIILPQALRSMIPSLTNQYLNCWKNSSLAILVGFTDFYSILNTVVNNAGHAVAIFSLILITYQAGSLTISAIMNNINNRVTKVKI
jgi:His/Glu/Gln/Arg/opine family amino acid ABC transporter permease subunit